MSKMIDRVARAIETELNSMIEPGATTTLWTLADKAARAAITAMQEPTEDMVAAVSGYDPPIGEQAWQAMIDAALKE